MVVKLLHQFLEGEDLPVAVGGPSQKSDEIDDRLRYKSLFDQILIGGVAAALGQLVVILVCDQRAVDIFGNLPAEGLIEAVVLGRGGDVLISADDMGDAHEVVVDDIGEIVGGIAVGLDEDHVVKLFILDRDIAVELVREGRGAFLGIVLADDIGHARSEIFLHFFFGQMETVLVVDIDLLALDGLGQ